MTIKHLYPTTRPSLDLNFAQTKRLDPRVTFTRGSTATYVGSDGLIKTAAADEARFDHDGATGESLGLLIEESRGNLVTYSEDFSGTGWAGATTVSGNATSAPDGNSTADLVYPSSSGFYRARYLPITTTGTATLSAFVKASGWQYINLGMVTTAASVKFDLVNNTFNIVDSNYTNVQMQAVGSGWYRIQATCDVATVSGNTFAIAFADDGVGGMYATANGTNGIYIWGAQLESGSFPTSYIPTTGSTATRNADVASMTGTNFSSWYNQSEGTYFLDATSPNDSTSGASDLLITDSYVNIRDYVGGGISRRNITSPDFDFNPAQAPVSKVAVAFDSTSANAAYAGALQTLDTTISNLPNTATQLSLGNGGQPGSLGRGHFARLAYYDRRLTDAQLQALTV